MKILLLGSTGQVGREVRLAASREGINLIGRSRQEVDFRDYSAIRAEVDGSRPDILINAAAFTQVDRAEAEAETAFQVNAGAVETLAEVCSARSIPLIHISTDYVFDGEKQSPYVETDTTNPLNVYGRSKLAGEEAIRRVGGPHVIVRTSWVYSSHGNNFVKTILRLSSSRPELRIVCDQVGGPTAAADIANALLLVADKLSSSFTAAELGTFHFQGAGSASWFEFAKAITKEASFQRTSAALIHPIPSTAYPTPAARPKNSRLECDKIFKAYGIRQRPWQESLTEVMTELRITEKELFQ